MRPEKKLALALLGRQAVWVSLHVDEIDWTMLYGDSASHAEGRGGGEEGGLASVVMFLLLLAHSPQHHN